MKQIDKEIKEKRSKVYYSKARIKPAYIFLVVPIFVGLAMGIDEFIETKMWGKALVYVLSLGTISSALFFLIATCAKRHFVGLSWQDFVLRQVETDNRDALCC